jgi:hypothetical protein
MIFVKSLDFYKKGKENNTLSGTTDKLNGFNDGLRNLKRELKKLGAGNKIKEF